MQATDFKHLFLRSPDSHHKGHSRLNPCTVRQLTYAAPCPSAMTTTRIVETLFHGPFSLPRNQAGFARPRRCRKIPVLANPSRAGRINLPRPTLKTLLTTILLATMPGLVSAAPNIAWEAARPFGYVMGDTIALSAIAEVPADWRLEEQQLPSPGQALNDWLEVRSLRWTHSGDDPALYRIEVAYQAFPSVTRAENLTIPPLTVYFQAGSETRTLTTPPWSFALAAQIPPYVRDEDVVIRPFAPPPRPSLTGPALGLALSLSLAFGTLVWHAWLNDRLPFFTRRPGPFARACRALRRETHYCSALRLLHRAFDETAGAAMFSGGVEAFLAQHPRFRPVADEIRAFHAASRLAFFADAPDHSAFPLPRLAALSQACRRIERTRPWR